MFFRFRESILSTQSRRIHLWYNNRVGQPEERVLLVVPAHILDHTAAFRQQQSIRWRHVLPGTQSSEILTSFFNKYLLLTPVGSWNTLVPRDTQQFGLNTFQSFKEDKIVHQGSCFSVYTGLHRRVFCCHCRRTHCLTTSRTNCACWLRYRSKLVTFRDYLLSM